MQWLLMECSYTQNMCLNYWISGTPPLAMQTYSEGPVLLSLPWNKTRSSDWLFWPLKSYNTYLFQWSSSILLWNQNPVSSFEANTSPFPQVGPGGMWCSPTEEKWGVAHPVVGFYTFHFHCFLMPSLPWPLTSSMVKKIIANTGKGARWPYSTDGTMIIQQQSFQVCMGV